MRAEVEAVAAGRAGDEASVDAEHGRGVAKRVIARESGVARVGGVHAHPSTLEVRLRVTPTVRLDLKLAAPDEEGVAPRHGRRAARCYRTERRTTKSSSSSRAQAPSQIIAPSGCEFAASDEAIARRASSDDRARRDVPVAMTDAFEFPDFFEYPPYFTCVPVPSRHASDLAPNTGRDDRTPETSWVVSARPPTVPFLPARSPHRPTRSPPRVPRAAFSSTRTPSVSRRSLGKSAHPQASGHRRRRIVLSRTRPLGFHLHPGTIDPRGHLTPPHSPPSLRLVASTGTAATTARSPCNWRTTRIRCLRILGVVVGYRSTRRAMVRRARRGRRG